MGNLIAIGLKVDRSYAWIRATTSDCDCKQHEISNGERETEEARRFNRASSRAARLDCNLADTVNFLTAWKASETPRGSRAATHEGGKGQFTIDPSSDTFKALSVSRSTQIRSRIAKVSGTANQTIGEYAREIHDKSFVWIIVRSRSDYVSAYWTDVIIDLSISADSLWLAANFIKREMSVR